MAYPVGLGAAWGFQMKNYSIVRIGNAYVVRAGGKSVLRVASRRSAVRLVTRAAELLHSQAAPQLVPEVQDAPSIARAPSEVA
jgi:hypothetical protein